MAKPDRNSKADSPAPNFIYVGGPKSGSTWLFEALRDHPEIFVYPGKSTEYFEKDTGVTFEEYLGFFKAAGNAKAIGEISHDVFLDDSAAERISGLFPEIKILICLREPGDFARSAIRWWSTHTTNYGETPSQMAKHPRLLALLNHHDRVAPFYKVFGRNKIKLLYFENLKSSPQVLLHDVYSFLGIDPDFKPAVLEKVVNPSLKPRSRLITHAAYSIGGFLRNMGLGALVEYVKHRPMVEKILYSRGYDEADSEMQHIVSRVRQECRPMIDKLEELTGQRVPDYWRKE